LASIDADNETAIKEICTKNNKKMTLNEFASKTLVEQHKDNLNKAHLYFYAPRPVRKKSSDISVTSTMTPAIEVKGEGGFKLTARHQFRNYLKLIHKS